MIELSPSGALMLYLGMTLAVVLGLWIHQHYRSRHKKVLTAENDLQVCEYCHCAYLADRGKALNQCPSCKLINKRT